MSRSERIRQAISGLINLDELKKFQSEGWKPVAVEWERELPEAEVGSAQSGLVEDPPFGLRVKDSSTLEEDPRETETLVAMMDLIIQDGPYSFIAQELNRKGYRTRDGLKWTSVSVFQMLPRLIDAGPKIFSTDEWRRKQESRRPQSRGVSTDFH